MGMANKYPRLQIDVRRGAPKSLRARYFIKGLWSSEELIRLCLSQKCRQRNAAEGGPRRRTTSPLTTRPKRTPRRPPSKQQRQPSKSSTLGTSYRLTGGCAEGPKRRQHAALRAAPAARFGWLVLVSVQKLASRRRPSGGVLSRRGSVHGRVRSVQRSGLLRECRRAEAYYGSIIC